MKQKGAQASSLKIPVEDWLLLLFHTKGKSIRKTSFEITTELFIFVKDLSPSAEPNLKFVSTYAGPYSNEIREAMNNLTERGFFIIPKSKEEKSGFIQYELTTKGNERAEKVASKLSPDIKKELNLLKTMVGNMGNLGMIQYLQSMHPEYIFLKTEV